MTPDLDARTGGCACGAIRFAAAAGPLAAGYCHCRICQRTAGAPVLAWAVFARGDFRWTSGEPAEWRSSAHGRRLFCARCGTQVAYLDDREPEAVSINTPTLDDPAAAPPAMHIWTQSRIPWFDTADDLPRHPGGV